MDGLTVRPAALSDLPTLLEFEQSMIEAERPFDTAIRTDDDVRYYDLEELIRSPEVNLVVAQVDGVIAGSGYARIEKSKPYLRHRRHSYLGFMYVVPQHRGKGVNKLILEALESWSAARGVSELRLEVYVENTPAIRAYTRAGYTSDLIEMRKSLAEDQM